jgi:hypothetical protein
MTKFARILTVAAVATATLTATPALAVPVGATTAATAKAQVVKPLSLTAKVNMDFGTILLTSIVAGSTYTVTLSSTGTLGCTAGLACSTTGIPATFNVTGSNNQLVKIYTARSGVRAPDELGHTGERFQRRRLLPNHQRHHRRCLHRQPQRDGRLQLIAYSIEWTRKGRRKRRPFLLPQGMNTAMVSS